MSEQDDQSRPDPPYGPPPSGQEQYTQPEPYAPPEQYAQQPYDQTQPYRQQQYGQHPYGPQYGPSTPYGQPQYGQQQYGHTAPYGQQPYGQPAVYGEQYAAPAPYGQYGPTAVPAKPPHVVVSAVLGFIYGAFGIFATLAAFVLGALAAGGSGSLEDQFPGISAFGGAIGGALVVVGVLALAWTVLMIWGSIWALTGRSRVLLLVGGSIALAMTALGFVGSLSDTNSGNGSSIFWSLLFVLAALAIVVLLSLRPAAQFYAAHRARRGR
jgi:hypothetical protein